MNAEATQASPEVLDTSSKPASAIVEYTKTEAALADLRDRIKGVVFDVKTTAGDKAARAARKECVTLRTALEEKRLELNAKDQERIRRRNTEAKRITSEIEALEDPIDEQIKAEETRKENEKKARAEVERQRVAAIHERIEDIRQQALDAVGEDAATIHARIQALAGLEIDDSFAEFKQQAEGAKATTLIRLRSAHAKATAHEAEQKRLIEERAQLEQQRQEEEARQAAERRLIAEEDARAKSARDEQNRIAREARETEDRRLAAERELAETRLGEIQGIQHQGYIATTGRLGVRKGGTRECIVETLLETEAWAITEEKFGTLLAMAREAKLLAISQIKEQLDRWDQRVREEDRLAEERAEIERAQAEQRAEESRIAARRAETERQESERRAALAVEEKRIADERAQLALEQEDLQRVREAGDGGPVGPTVLESSKSMGSDLANGQGEEVAREAGNPQAAARPSEAKAVEPDRSLPESYIDIVFDGPAGHESGRLVEVEDSQGASIHLGEWVDRGNGLWALRIPATADQIDAIPEMVEMLRTYASRCEGCQGAGEIQTDDDNAEVCSSCKPIWDLVERATPKQPPPPPRPIQPTDADYDDDLPF